MNPAAQLDSFLAKYTPEIQAAAKIALDKMRKRYPSALELVYDNYNALAIGFSPGERVSEAIFSIALYPRWVSLFFLQAKKLPDPDKLLQGSGTQAKHIVLTTPEKLDEPAVKKLMKEAVAVATHPFVPSGTHRLIIKSVSAKQRPRRPADPTAKTRNLTARKAKAGTRA